MALFTDKKTESEKTPAHTPPAAHKPVTERTPAEKAFAEAKPAVVTETKAAETTKPELSLDDIAGGYMLSAALVEATAPVRARSEKQTAMDTKVAELHKLWVAAGKPNTWNKMVNGRTVATYFVYPELAADLKQLINRAVAFVSTSEVGIRVKYGTPFLVTEKHIKAHNLPADYVGREAISFAIMDKRERGTTSDGTPASQIVDK